MSKIKRPIKTVTPIKPVVHPQRGVFLAALAEYLASDPYEERVGTLLQRHQKLRNSLGTQGRLDKNWAQLTVHLVLGIEMEPALKAKLRKAMKGLCE